MDADYANYLSKPTTEVNPGTKMKDGKGAMVQVSSIIAREIDPSAGEEAVVWRLLTNRDAATPEDVIELSDW